MLSVPFEIYMCICVVTFDTNGFCCPAVTPANESSVDSHSELLVQLGYKSVCNSQWIDLSWSGAEIN